MNRLSRLVLPILGSLLLCLAATPAGAQGGRERLRAEIERTDEALERAAGHLRPQSCAIGQQLIERAREQQGRAKELFVRDAPPSDRLALKLTLEARRNIHAALDACETRGRVAEGLQELLANVQDLAESARSALSDRPSAAGERFYQTGVEQIRRAREAYRRGQTRQCVRFLSIARNLFQRVLHSGDLPGTEARATVEIVLERSDALLLDLRAAQKGDADPGVLALLARAEELQARARDLLRDGNLAQAVGVSTLARSAALEAHWELRRLPEADRVADAIDVIETSCEEISSSGLPSQSAQEFLRRARDLAASARSALAAGDTEAAATSIRAAESFMRRAAEEAGAR